MPSVFLPRKCFASVWSNKLSYPEFPSPEEARYKTYSVYSEPPSLFRKLLSYSMVEIYFVFTVSYEIHRG